MDENRRKMDELLQSRDLIESSLRQSIRELEEIGVGPNDSLLDSEGYPRADIDLYRVRTLRSSIARQQNDYKDIMKKIEILLPHVIPSANSVQVEPMNYLEPFAKIGVVPTNSFAYKLGICPNDFIIKFGDITKEKFVSKDLKLIASEFARFQASGSELEVKLKRSSETGIKSIKIDCRTIESLGCQILPL